MTGATATSLSSIFELSAEPERQSLVVSVHDVAPATRPRVEEIVAELAHHGVQVCSLLVVPNYHHRGCFTEDRAFVRWLQELEAKGHEIVIHGYFHERPARNGESVNEKFFTRLYTKGEGEFYDLEYEEALRRICRAREEFTGAGLTPRGFIAPAWLLGPAAERAAADAEMEYTTRLTGVRDLRSGEDYRARTLAYSVRSGWRRDSEPGLEHRSGSSSRRAPGWRALAFIRRTWTIPKSGGSYCVSPTGWSKIGRQRRIGIGSPRDAADGAVNRFAHEPLRPPYSFPLQCALGGMALPAVRFSRQLHRSARSLSPPPRARHGLRDHHGPRHDRRESSVG